MNKTIKKYFSGLNKNIFLITLSSFFADVATEMLYPLLPIFLTQTLKASGSILGVIEGIAQAALYSIQGFSGFLADKFQKRKTVAVIGYTLSAIAKPFIGAAAIWPEALAARFFDRFGAGIRSASRDALITSSVDTRNKGKAFGMEGIGDNFGAFIGPLVTLLLYFVLSFNIRTVFYLSFIPGFFSVLTIVLIKTKKNAANPGKFDHHLKQFPPLYWKYLFVTAIFSIGNSSNAFLILLTREKGGSLELTIVLYALFNLSAALISLPSGSLSDKIGRKKLLLLAFFIFFISYAGFAFVPGIFIIGIIYFIYGFYQGIFKSVGRSYVTDFIPHRLEASGIGWYSTIVGLSQLIASIIAGFLWDGVSHSSVFIFGAASAFAGIILLAIFIPEKKSAAS